MRSFRRFPHPTQSREEFLNQAHVDPDAHHKTGFLLDILEGMVWCGHRLLDARDWFRQSRVRRQWGLGLAAALVVIGFIAIVGLPQGQGPVVVDGPKPPPPVAKTGTFTYMVETGDSTGSIANTFHTTVEQIVADNLSLFEANTEWCRKRPVSQAYLEGRLPTGQKRASEFCVLTTVGKRKLAITTLKLGQQLTLPCNAHTTNIAACSQDAIASSD